MKTYCVNCRKKTENLDSKILKQKTTDTVKYPVCGIKKSTFVK